MTWIGWAAVAVVVLIVVDRLALAAESRGWIYWRRRKPTRSTVGTAVLRVQAIFEPQIEHVVEERAEIGADQPGDDEPGGDPPDGRHRRSDGHHTG
jgi:hypothetical protein